MLISVWATCTYLFCFTNYEISHAKATALLDNLHIFDFIFLFLKIQMPD